jgi:hypothetical protein
LKDLKDELQHNYLVHRDLEAEIDRVIADIDTETINRSRGNVGNLRMVRDCKEIAEITKYLY